MPGFIAKKLCPELIFVSSHFDRVRRFDVSLVFASATTRNSVFVYCGAQYEEMSALSRAVFAQYDPDFEAMSLDEAYLVIII
jgi:DNA polymerase kappa